jgi:[amino group carrier protein]-L-2-aminoadipate 6-kinase
MMIVKIGGGKGINVRGIVEDLAQVSDPYLIVHGANTVRDEIAAKMGYPTKVVTSVSGYTSVLSDERAIDAIMMGYAGLKNKRIVELFQQHGVNAVGLSGIDGRLVQGQRNKGIRVRQAEKTLIMRDFSGKPSSVNAHLLRLLLDNGYVPVLSIPIIDEHNTAINSENDDIVNVLQAALHAASILQLIEAPGFLDDKDDESTLVPAISVAELEVRESQVEGRMKRKMLALRRLFEEGAHRLVMSDGRVEHPVRDALSGKGTVIQ